MAVVTLTPRSCAALGKSTCYIMRFVSLNNAQQLHPETVAYLSSSEAVTRNRAASEFGSSAVRRRGPIIKVVLMATDWRCQAPRGAVVTLHNHLLFPPTSAEHFVRGFTILTHSNLSSLLGCWQWLQQLPLKCFFRRLWRELFALFLCLRRSPSVSVRENPRPACLAPTTVPPSLQSPLLPHLDKSHLLVGGNLALFSLGHCNFLFISVGGKQHSKYNSTFFLTINTYLVNWQVVDVLVLKGKHSLKLLLLDLRFHAMLMFIWRISCIFYLFGWLAIQVVGCGFDPWLGHTKDFNNWYSLPPCFALFVFQCWT